MRNEEGKVKREERRDSLRDLMDTFQTKVVARKVQNREFEVTPTKNYFLSLL